MKRSGAVSCEVVYGWLRSNSSPASNDHVRIGQQVLTTCNHSGWPALDAAVRHAVCSWRAVARDATPQQIIMARRIILISTILLGLVADSQQRAEWAGEVHDKTAAEKSDG